jgi:two-component system, chemotaxis family, response regulator Rcp1
MPNLVLLPTSSICDKPAKIETNKADADGQAVHDGNGITIQVLLVEDSLGDVLLTQEAFRDINSFVHVHVAITGVEAMAFLRHQEPYVNAPRPDLVLLDLTLAETDGRMDGREVLALIKADESLKSIPTVILTASQATADSVKCYQLHANAYAAKPMRYEAFRSLVKNINDLWLADCSLSKESKRKSEGLSVMTSV